MKKLNLNILILSVLALVFSMPLVSQETHPRLILSDSEKEALINKIAKYDWAKNSYKGFMSAVDIYVDRHKTDPMWIISRIQLYWNKPYYTTGSRSGDFFVSPTGEAPIPTIRHNSHLRIPTAPDGYNYLTPSIDNVTPYSVNGKQRLQSSSPAKTWYDNVDPRVITASINGNILKMALISSFLYYMTGQEKYAIFASDIFMVFAEALAHHTLISGTGSQGLQSALLTLQTLNEAPYSEQLPLIYDFIYNYLKKTDGKRKLVMITPEGEKHEYLIKLTPAIEKMFLNWCQTMVERGNPGNNWDMVNSYSLIMSALMLTNQASRNTYIQYYTTLDGPRQSSMQTMLHHYTESGMIMEPPGYHAYPLAPILNGAFIHDRSGGQNFFTYPKLYRSAYALSYQIAPSGEAAAYGNHHSRPKWFDYTVRPMEIAYAAALKLGEVEYAEKIGNWIGWHMSKGFYKRTSQPASIDGLIILCTGAGYISVTKQPDPKPVTWKEDYSQFYGMQNGDDPLYGLFAYMSGGSHTHAHANGINMELFGRGYFLGTDAGSAINYENEEHKHYYVQYAAHNTVVINGKSDGGNSSSVWSIKSPTITYPQVEPLSGEKPANPNVSFMTARFSGAYNVTSSLTALQERTIAIVRTSSKSGYIIDIFRSKANDVNDKHEYLYHNFGDSAKFTTSLGEDVSMSSIADSTINSGDLDEWLGTSSSFRGPGYRGPSGQYFLSRKKSTPLTNDMVASFAITKLPSANQKEIPSMKAHIVGESGRTYFTAMGPVSHVAPTPYNDELCPVIAVRQNGEAWTKPFAVVYDPHEEGHPTVANVRKILPVGGVSGNLTILKVVNTTYGELSEQFLYSATNANLLYTNSADTTETFRGLFGTTSRNEAGEVEYIYLGKGRNISSDKYSIASTSTLLISASVYREGEKFIYSADGNCRVQIPWVNKNSDLAYSNLVLLYEKDGHWFHATSVSVTPSSGVTTAGEGIISGVVPKANGATLLVAERGKYLYSVVSEVTTTINGTSFKREAILSDNNILKINFTGVNPISKDMVSLMIDGTELAASATYTSSVSGKLNQLTLTLANPTPGTYIYNLSEPAGGEINGSFKLSSSQYGSRRIEVWPNPVAYGGQDTLDIRGFVKSGETLSNIKIIDFRGNIVMQLKTTAHSGEVLVWDLKNETGKKQPRGLYFCHAEVDGGDEKVTVSSKIMIR